jgi:hypothetical protein
MGQKYLLFSKHTNEALFPDEADEVTTTERGRKPGLPN